MEKGLFQASTKGTKKAWSTKEMDRYLSPVAQHTLATPTTTTVKQLNRSPHSQPAKMRLKSYSPRPRSTFSPRPRKSPRPSTPPKPVTPVKSWENVPRRDMTTKAEQMPSFLSTEVTLNQPTYLPYGHSRDLLLAVHTLQTSCGELNNNFAACQPLVQALETITEEMQQDRQLQEENIQVRKEHCRLMEQMITETKRANNLQERQLAIINQALEKGDPPQAVQIYLNDLRFR
jgi:hypothetical protein